MDSTTVLTNPEAEAEATTLLTEEGQEPSQEQEATSSTPKGQKSTDKQRGVSVNTVTQALAEGNHQRGIRLTQTAGYVAYKDPDSKDVIITFYAPKGYEQQEGISPLKQYEEALKGASLAYELDEEVGEIRVTGRAKMTSAGRGQGISPEEAQARGIKLTEYWKTHTHPMKGRNISEEAKRAIQTKLLARGHLIQEAAQLYLTALEQVDPETNLPLISLPEGLGISNEDAMLMVKKLAAGELSSTRKRALALRQQEEETAPLPSVEPDATDITNGHNEEGATTLLNDGSTTLLVDFDTPSDTEDVEEEDTEEEEEETEDPDNDDDDEYELEEEEEEEEEEGYSEEE